MVKLQQMIFTSVVLATVIVAGVQCSDYDAKDRVMHSHEDEVEAHTRIAMLKGNSDGDFGARAHIKEDTHGRKQAHAVAFCDCNGQGSWRPLFKPSQLLKTQYPEHHSIHDEVDSHFQNPVSDQVDNHLSAETSGLPRHNHMIHLHLIPHIYVPVMHHTGFAASPTEAKHADHQSHVVDDSSLLNQDVSSEFPNSDHIDTANGGGGGGSGSTSSSVSGEHIPAEPEQTNYNGHSGESYYTITEDTGTDQELNEHYPNISGIGDSSAHDDFDINSIPDGPHTYQVHESDDMSKDYSSKKHVLSAASSSSLNVNKKPLLPKYRKSAPKPSNRSKHGRKLSNRQDLKNLLVMRPPPLGQSQTWRYAYPPPPRALPMPIMPRHQFYQRKHQLLPMPMPMPKPVPMPMHKSRTVPVILHIRQRNDK